MKFGTWCEKDPDDERKINYRFTDKDGNVSEFTSEGMLPWEMFSKLYDARIATVVLKDNEWYADLYEE